MKVFTFRGRPRRTTRPDTRPCAACGLAPRIRLNRNLGRYCLYYGVRIPSDETREMTVLRRHCMRDGNHFVWPVEGYTAKELLAWKMTHADWHLKRTAIKVVIIVTLASMALAPFGVMFSPFF